MTIICHQHKFIFIKTRKTAGTSIETALARYCSDDDVITALSDDDEATRAEAGVRSAQNLHVPIRRYGLGELRNLARGERTRFYNHTPASDVKRFVSRSNWRDYYVFCVERNPFDRAISQYHWKNRKNADSLPPMPEFFRNLSMLSMSNWSLYTSENKIVVDEVVKYESLDSDLKRVGEKLGIDIDISNIHAKAWTRNDRRNYWEVLDQESRSIIEDRCAKEISHFGYEWRSN